MNETCVERSMLRYGKEPDGGKKSGGHNTERVSALQSDVSFDSIASSAVHSHTLRILSISLKLKSKGSLGWTHDRQSVIRLI